MDEISKGFDVYYVAFLKAIAQYTLTGLSEERSVG